MRTLMENVYIAKLAVLTSRPRISTTHCPFSGLGRRYRREPEDMFMLGGLISKLALHGVFLSESSTPRSRASCSRVIGMKEPIEVVSSEHHSA
jgi:hypothetical protein